MNVFQRFDGFIVRVQWQGWSVLAESLLVGERRVFFLKMAGIGKHNSGNIHSCRRRQNLTMKAVLDQAGDVTNVVQMRMRQ